MSIREIGKKIGKKLGSDSKEYAEYCELKARKLEMDEMRGRIASEFTKLKERIPDIKSQIWALDNKIQRECEWMCDAELDVIQKMAEFVSINSRIDFCLEQIQSTMEKKILDEEIEIARRLGAMESEGNIFVETDQAVQVVESIIPH